MLVNGLKLPQGCDQWEYFMVVVGISSTNHEVVVRLGLRDNNQQLECSHWKHASLPPWHPGIPRASYIPVTVGCRGIQRITMRNNFIYHFRNLWFYLVKKNINLINPTKSLNVKKLYLAYFWYLFFAYLLGSVPNGCHRDSNNKYANYLPICHGYISAAVRWSNLKLQISFVAAWTYHLQIIIQNAKKKQIPHTPWVFFCTH